MKRAVPVFAAVLLLCVCSFAAAAPLAVYDDQLRNGFANWSWAANDLAQGGTVRSGRSAISFEPDGWSGLFLHRDEGIDTAFFDALELWVHGGAAGGQNLRIALVAGGDPAGEGALSGFLAGGSSIPRAGWVRQERQRPQVESCFWRCRPVRRRWWWWTAEETPGFPLVPV